MPNEHQHMNQKQTGGLQKKAISLFFFIQPRGQQPTAFIPLLWLTCFREGEFILGGNNLNN